MLDRSAAIALPGQRRAPGNMTISEPPLHPRGAGSERTGPLAGARLIVKDNIDAAGYVTTCGSRAYDPEPAAASAPAVARLVNAGALVVGKANLDEFAWGVTGENTHWGRIANPAHPGLTTGGSSGGTAAMIAAGLADIGLGTDTAGSIRIPAACCGIVGLRPRTGTTPVDGIHPLAPSFDVVGPMARDVGLLILAWEAMSGAHGAGSAGGELRAGRAPLEAPRVAAMRLPGWPAPAAPEHWGPIARVDVDRAALEPFWTVMHDESYRTHRARYEAGAEGYGPAIRAKLAAAAASAGDVDAARTSLAAHRDAFARVLDAHDAVLAPALGRSIPAAGVDEATIRAELGWPSALFSALDAAVACVGGLQIVARDEATALECARQFEAALRRGAHPHAAHAHADRSGS